MSDVKKPETPEITSDAVMPELSDDQLGKVSGGNASGWDYRPGQTWVGKCPVCKKKTTHTCIHQKLSDCFRYTWWQCGECGSVRRWNPGFVWASWDSKVYKDADEAMDNDDEWFRRRNG